MVNIISHSNANRLLLDDARRSSSFVEVADDQTSLEMDEMVAERHQTSHSSIQMQEAGGNQKRS